MVREGEASRQSRGGQVVGRGWQAPHLSLDCLAGNLNICSHVAALALLGHLGLGSHPIYCHIEKVCRTHHSHQLLQILHMSPQASLRLYQIDYPSQYSIPVNTGIKTLLTLLLHLSNMGSKSRMPSQISQLSRTTHLKCDACHLFQSAIVYINNIFRC
jgi:hypothetical protein